MVLACQRNRRGIHHPQIAGQDLQIVESFETLGARLSLGVRIVDAVHLGSLQERVTTHFGGPESRRRIGGEIRVAGPGGENYDAILLEMPQRPASDIRFANRLHRDGRLHAGGHSAALQLVLHGERVNHRCEHAHVIRRCALHADRGARHAAKDVAAADHHANLDAERVHRLDLACDASDHLGIETVFARAHQRFARQFQELAAVLEIG